jgi:FlaA1/EpsC-like NDP-sugar epimerase
MFSIYIGNFIAHKFLYPRSVIIIDLILSFCFTVGIRYIEKFILYKNKLSDNESKRVKRCLIIGAGEAGNIVLREIRNHPEAKIKVIGFIDDDKNKIGCSIGGKLVLGDRSKIVEIVKKKGIDLIIIAIPSASKKDINDIINICEKTNAKVKIVPSTIEIIKGDVKFEQIRDINIEDLLSRPEIKLDIKEVSEYISNRIVLITGAGGSIGSEIARQVAQFGPQKLILLGKGENSIFNIHFELSNKYRDLELFPAICDIRDRDKVEKIFKEFKPDIVFHAAAHKHVFLMELHPDEAFKNNVIGTLNLAEASIKHNVKKFILISTDKAVNPKSVMGLTKRIAEKIVLGYMKSKKNNKTKFIVVRFGNVLASRGSVVPIFKAQIEKGGPLTVTHPEVKRYFMTIPEAVQLVLQASAMGNGGEIFILNMGKAVKIKELAEKMIKLSGYEPYKDIKIEYIGLKPGEKLEEQLYEEDREKIYKTKYSEIFKGVPSDFDFIKLMEQINKFNSYSKTNNFDIVNYLKKLVEI